MCLQVTTQAAIQGRRNSSTSAREAAIDLCPEAGTGSHLLCRRHNFFEGSAETAAARTKSCVQLNALQHVFNYTMLTGAEKLHLPTVDTQKKPDNDSSQNFETDLAFGAAER